MTVEINGKPYPKYWRYPINKWRYNVWLTEGVDDEHLYIIRCGTSSVFHSSLNDKGWRGDVSLDWIEQSDYEPLNLDEE